MAKYLNLTGLQTLWTKIKAALDGKSPTTHTHTVKINGAEKTIAATGGTAVDLGTYLTAHQDISGKANLANTSQAILSEPSQAATKYLIVSQTTFGGSATSTWMNYDLSMIIQSRHSGTGLAVIQCNTNTSTPTETSLSGTINIFTTTTPHRINSPLMMYRKYDASTYKWTITVVVSCTDYNNFKIKSVLSKNGLNYSTSCTYVTDLTTLGTQIATAVTASNSNHTHGNITNAGALQTTDIAIANGDKLVVTDSSNSSKVARTSLSFDGSTTTKALTPKGTWESFAKSSEIPEATTTTPKMDGTAAVGSETKWAKGDHVHPSDTSRVPTTRKVNGHALSADVTVTAADVSAVRYDTNAQGLTDTQKGNARTNIGAGTSNLALGTSSTTAAKGDHTHTTSIASDGSSGTVVTLAHNTQYKLTAGGTSVLFKTPSDSNTDTKVTQSKDDIGTTAFPLLMAGATDPNGTATTARYDSDVKLTPSTNTISANISGTAATAKDYDSSGGTIQSGFSSVNTSLQSLSGRVAGIENALGGYKIVVGSLGQDTDAIYFVTT